MNITSMHDATTAATTTAAAGQSANSSNSTSSSNPLGDTQSMFLTLLTTELKTQDPTAPEDPTQMVDQLVQFNSLNQLISINTSMDTLVGDAGGTTGQTASATTPVGGN